LSREFDWLDDFVDGLLSDCGASGGDEFFCRVHVLRFVLKERNCSLHHAPREQGRSGRNAPARARAAGQRSLSNRVTAGANWKTFFACWREVAAEQPEARARAG